MLQFQAGEYCICITEDERATQDHQGYTVTVTVQTFGQGTDGKAQKVLEKAQALYVLAETITACLDLVSALGCSEEEFQKKLDMVNESNARKEH